MTPIFKLKRNDLEAALAYYRERGDAITPEQMRALVTLQDDPTALLDEISKLTPAGDKSESR